MRALRPLVAAAAALVVAAAPARAATYTVETCDNGSVSGWSHFAFGAWSTWSDGCGIAGGALGATIETEATSHAGWTFTAPPDTEIAGFRVTRSYRLAANRVYGTSGYQLLTEGSGRGYYHDHPNFAFEPVSSGLATESASGLSGQTSLTARLYCGGGIDCTAGSALAVYAAGIDLADDASPTIVATSGSLLAGGAQRGTRSLSYAAVDRGGGVRRERLLVDGQPVIDRVADDNGGACAAPPYVRTVPCKLAVSDTLAVDTTRLADGVHRVELVVWDATEVNQTRLGPFEIEVDNVPPPISTRAPAVAGAAPFADAGAVLTAAFETSGQVAATLRWGQERRIVGTLRRRDGEPIPSATVSVTSRARVAGAAPVPLGTVATDVAGRFAYVLGPGASRTIGFASHGATATVRVRVIPHVLVRARRSGGGVILTGRVSGAPSGVRAPVELQARHGRVWRTFATTRLARTGGTFRYRHAGPARRFRAVIRATPGWPFLTRSATAVLGPARAARPAAPDRRAGSAPAAPAHRTAPSAATRDRRAGSAAAAPGAGFAEREPLEWTA